MTIKLQELINNALKQNSESLDALEKLMVGVDASGLGGNDRLIVYKAYIARCLEVTNTGHMLRKLLVTHCKEE